MRLTKQEQQIIKKVFKESFEDGKIYLFGSRTDDTQRGGDIDLYIETNNKKDMLSKKIKFLASLKDAIGDQKIDVIISKDKTRVIEQEAISKGIEL